SDHAWIATQSGYLLEVYLDKSFTVSLKAYHYPDKQFRKLIGDRAGNIWCATQKGLSMLTAEYLNKIELPPPYALQQITAIAYGTKDILWIAQNRNLYRVSLSAVHPLMQRVYQAPAPISCLFNDRENRLWMGTMGKGLSYRTEQGSIIKAEEIESIKNGNILSISGTSDRLWVAALTGVYELAYPDKQRKAVHLIKHHNKQSGIGSDYVYFLFPDRKGQIWMATDGAGICMYSGDNYHHWENLDRGDEKVVYSITEDMSGDIWAGAYYKGLYYFNHNQWKAMKQENETDANVSAVTANASGQVMAVYERCIDEWYPNSRQFRHYNYRLDLGIDSTTSVLNCVAKDFQGNVYIPFEHGLLIFNNQSKIYDITPGVQITDIQVLTKPLKKQKKEFNYDENYFTFKFEGISFTNPERLNYRYKLEGLGDKWIATHDESITFPKLPSGNYTFRVQAALDGSFGYAKEDTFSFTINEPLWKRSWFLILLGCLAFFVVYWLIKLREKRQKKLVQLEQERMNFEYEHLKSQVNPHFLFNSLNTLSNLIEEDGAAAVSYTERLSDLYKNILAYRNRDLITLKEDWEILSNYLFVQQCRFGNAFQVQFDVSEELLKTKKIVPMCLQMLVENAIKHNIVSLTQPLRIKIWSDKDEIIASNPLQPKVSKEDGSGLGLINISNRYHLLTKREVVFGPNEKEFVVRIPLL
ncbi:MAG TPA: histidine kinase, partial [Arachidicoccus sp.]|nr:histidine kinase [Arachidicoccus sp.]